MASRNIMKRHFIAMAFACLALASTAGVPRVKLGDEIKDGRPSVRWRGFNLLEMFIMGRDRRPREFREEDFQIIHDWGFNFVRLPMDYRYWIKDGDRKNWEVFDENHLAYIDRAIALGRKYGVHVSINMHRCPGYTVARPKEPTDLFADAETLRVCCAHWAMFARRYKGIPNEALSFNLFNEPPQVAEESYARVAKALVAAIRAEDPERFIIADGLGYGRQPMPSLADVKGVGQATRGYEPMSVSHYLAPWVGTPTAKPVWPLRADLPSGIVAGDCKKDMRRPLVICDLPAGTLDVAFGKVSGVIEVKFSADGKLLRTVTLKPDETSPSWSGVKYYPEWRVSQGTYLVHETFVFTNAVSRFEVVAARGDWLQLGGLTFVSPDGQRKAELPFNSAWSVPSNFTQCFLGWERGFASAEAAGGAPRYADEGKEYLYRKTLREWDPLIEKGVFCFAGEFGVWKMTPHDIVLDIFEDYLYLWKERNMGWALWNLRGSIGVLDSERDDVEYENFRGHKLDRKMLDLLQRY
jgi:aryl-phospho-beta-D-glucosidase BglC (GH1 family)